MVSLWSAAILIAFGVGTICEDDAISKWPKCDLPEDYIFREEPKRKFLNQLFSSDSAAASKSYRCYLEAMAGLMIEEPSLLKVLNDGTGLLSRTTFSRPIKATETEWDVLITAATGMKVAVEKKLSAATQFGCNYAKKDDNHEVVCVFMK